MARVRMGIIATTSNPEHEIVIKDKPVQQPKKLLKNKVVIAGIR